MPYNGIFLTGRNDPARGAKRRAGSDELIRGCGNGWTYSGGILSEIAVSAIHLQSKNQVSNFGEAVVTIFPALVTG